MTKDITYAGNRTIPAEHVQQLRDAVDNVLAQETVVVKGEPRMGTSVTYLMDRVRDTSRLRNFPRNISDQQSMFQALGYSVGPANPPKKFSDGEFTARVITAVYL